MTASVALPTPSKKNGRHFYTVTLGATNDTVTFRPGSNYKFDIDPILADVKVGGSDIIIAQYSQSPVLTPAAASFLAMSYGEIDEDLTVVWDFYADSYRLVCSTGGGSTVVHVSSPIQLAYTTA